MRPNPTLVFSEILSNVVTFEELQSAWSYNGFHSAGLYYIFSCAPSVGHGPKRGAVLKEFRTERSFMLYSGGGGGTREGKCDNI